MSSSASSCILFVQRSTEVDVSAITHAQQAAITERLPLAVIYCLEEWEDFVLKKLSAAENALASCNIPLIILLGPAAKTLNGIIHHTRPLEVFYEESPPDNVSMGTLTRHPYPWTGRVISIAELSELHAAGQLAC